jgi:hypothetical protein
MNKTHLLLCLMIAFSSEFIAQNLNGAVLDAKGMPLPGASVVADGSNGQFTNSDGRFNLSLSAGTHQVNFSYIGYVAQTKTITMTESDMILNVTLAEDAVLIEDVVVVGYGVQRKKEVTGSIVQVDAKQITGVQTPSFEAALQGQACRSTGEPVIGSGRRSILDQSEGSSLSISCRRPIVRCGWNPHYSGVLSPRKFGSLEQQPSCRHQSK